MKINVIYVVSKLKIVKIAIKNSHKIVCYMWKNPAVSDVV